MLFASEPEAGTERHLHIPLACDKARDHQSLLNTMIFVNSSREYIKAVLRERIRSKIRKMGYLLRYRIVS